MNIKTANNQAHYGNSIGFVLSLTHVYISEYIKSHQNWFQQQYRSTGWICPIPSRFVHTVPVPVDTIGRAIGPTLHFLLCGTENDRVNFHICVKPIVLFIQITKNIDTSITSQMSKKLPSTVAVPGGGGAACPHTAQKCSRFHAVFRKIWKVHMLVPPPTGNSGSAPEVLQ